MSAVMRQVTAAGEPVSLSQAAVGVGWSSFSKDPERLLALAESYVRGPDRALYVVLERGRLVGLVGVTGCTGPTITIGHIGVHPDHRGRGVGAFMVDQLGRAHPGASLEAETDGEAVGFYRRVGFRATSLGEKHPGFERFLCTLGPMRDRG